MNRSGWQLLLFALIAVAGTMLTTTFHQTAQQAQTKSKSRAHSEAESGMGIYDAQTASLTPAVQRALNVSLETQRRSIHSRYLIDGLTKQDDADLACEVAEGRAQVAVSDRVQDHR